MDLGISGRTAIICASSRGLGKACAMALAENGVDVTINGRDENTLKSTAEEIADLTGVRVNAIATDVSSLDGQQRLLAANPAPDILINNNGGPPLKDFRQLDRQAIVDGVIQNMVTPIELIKAVLEPMCQNGFGRIVNITSLSVKMPILGLDLSSGARAGLTAFLAGPAREIADKGVTINNLLPGMFDTDRLQSSTRIQAKMKDISEQQMAENRAATVPAKRFGNPLEFGQTCAFLCSAHAGYITGQSIMIDGGLHNSVM